MIVCLHTKIRLHTSLILSIKTLYMHTNIPTYVNFQTFLTHTLSIGIQIWSQSCDRELQRQRSCKKLQRHE
jgi:hypothetical protein